MKISKIKLSGLRNAAHNALMSHFGVVVNKHGAVKLGIGTLFSAFVNTFKLETDFMAQTPSSNITDSLVTLDKVRDQHYRSFTANTKSLTLHYDVAISTPARHIMHVLDAKDDISRYSYNDKTIEINNVITELYASYAADVKATNLGEWISILKTKNDAFDTASKDRNNQQAGKIHAKNKELRDATNKAYTAVIKRIDSLIEVNGEANYKAFVNEYNEYVEKEKNLLAQRAGRAAVAKKNKVTAKNDSVKSEV